MIARPPVEVRCAGRWLVWSLVAYLLFLASSPAAHAELPAFPGAEGFGAVSLGGRGGQVIRVTNLNAAGPGSLQAACEAEGPRIVVFAVAGVIRSDIAIKHSRITIAGQTAPAPGITVVGRLLARPAGPAQVTDVVVQHLRFRPPPTQGVDGDVVQLPHVRRVVLDHLSLAWGNDEMLDLSHASDITLQWSTIEESDPQGHAKNVPHNFAFFSAYPGSGNISVHKNLFAHHARRIPSISPAERDRPGDFRNNVVYNFRDGLSHEGHPPRSPINLIGNYYKRGPSASEILLFAFHWRGDYFVSDNFVEGFGMLSDPRRPGTRLPSWLRAKGSGGVLDAPARTAPVLTNSPLDAYRQVMLRAGAFPRDRITQRTVAEVEAGTGAWGRHGPHDPPDTWFLADLAREPVARDSDADGMPDGWERGRGLNPRDPRDAARAMPSGYTAVEEYLHFRAEQLTSKQPITGVTAAKVGR